MMEEIRIWQDYFAAIVIPLIVIAIPLYGQSVPRLLHIYRAEVYRQDVERRFGRAEHRPRHARDQRVGAVHLRQVRNDARRASACQRSDNCHRQDLRREADV